MQSQLWYQIALTCIPDVGPILRKRLIEHFGSAKDVFNARKKELSCIDGIGDWAIKQLKNWNDFSIVEAELKFIEKNNIEPLFITDKSYPHRLLNCPDAPTMLYWKGHTNLNASRIVSMIGTRNNTNYGKHITESIIETLPKDVLIISGLAFGIDAIAHKAALKNELPTVGVLGHGLDNLYPSQHLALAKEMQNQGGLLTEFGQNTKADKHNFPRRNRIVAGMADATIVVETAEKGGSMITADLAFQYNRELFAVPGRLNDSKSAGCLQLIQQNKAIVYSDITYFLETMRWTEKKTPVKKQLDLFSTLSREEQLVVEILQEKDLFTIDELNNRTQLNTSRMAAILLSLELQNIIHIIPGKMIALA